MSATMPLLLMRSAPPPTGIGMTATSPAGRGATANSALPGGTESPASAAEQTGAEFVVVDHGDVWRAYSSCPNCRHDRSLGPCAPSAVPVYLLPGNQRPAGRGVRSTANALFRADARTTSRRPLDRAEVRDINARVCSRWHAPPARGADSDPGRPRHRPTCPPTEHGLRPLIWSPTVASASWTRIRVKPSLIRMAAGQEPSGWRRAPNAGPGDESASRSLCPRDGEARLVLRGRRGDQHDHVARPAPVACCSSTSTGRPGASHVSVEEPPRGPVALHHAARSRSTTAATS